MGTAGGAAWAIDPGVARDLAGLVGWVPGTGPVALVGALADEVPAGTTAKLAAMAAGEVPPGADPEAVARRILEDRSAGRPTPAWSCWALSTVMAALLATGDGVDARVAAIRRIDDRAPAVDFHSVVVTPDASGRSVICDPYFAAVFPGPGAEGRDGVHRGVRAERIDEPDGQWAYRVSNGRWSAALHYRLFAPTLDAGDVHALCAVSVTHSGVPPGPTARLLRADLGTDAYVHAAGGAAVRERPPGRPDEDAVVAEHPDWAAAAADFGARTGVAIL